LYSYLSEKALLFGKKLISVPATFISVTEKANPRYGNSRHLTSYVWCLWLRFFRKSEKGSSLLAQVINQRRM